MPIFKILFPASIVILLFLMFMSITDNDIVAGDEIGFMNGVSFVAPPNEFTENPFSSIVDINANWVAIMPFAFTNGNTPEVLFDRERQWWGEKTKGTVKTIELAKQKNLKILLKPHVWVRGQGWTGEFMLSTDDEWEKWERAYTTYILNYARIADSMNVEAFSIGLEFKNVVKERPEFWIDLIKKVRANYHGKLTYASNWDNYQNVTFWDELDFIGIDAYFPMSQEETPSVEILKASWKNEKESLFDLSRKHQKPIVFTEYGYRSMDKGAGNQWELEHHRRFKGQPNFEVQKNAYMALYETFWNESWFKGGFLWKWYPDQDRKLDPNNSDYTPQKKPVEKVIMEWYKKR